MTKKDLILKYQNEKKRNKELLDFATNNELFTIEMRRQLDNVFLSILNDLKNLSGETVKVQSFCNPPNIDNCMLDTQPDYDCSKCKWKIQKRVKRNSF